MSMHHSRELLFDDTAATEIYTLSLHGALPILAHEGPFDGRQQPFVAQRLRDDCGLRDVVVRAGPRGHGGPPAGVQQHDPWSSSSEPITGMSPHVPAPSFGSATGTPLPASVRSSAALPLA